MATERFYGVTGKAPAKPLSGQAKVVFDGMTTIGGTATAKQWTELVGGEIKTRQDVYRVVLYYILIFKKRGLVAVINQEPVPGVNVAIPETSEVVPDDFEGVSDAELVHELEDVTADASE